jgi:hypothetical protein
MRAAQRIRVLRQRWLSIFRKADQDAALEEELAFHLEQLTAEHIADGLSLADARAAAKRALGNVSVLAEECRDERRTTWVHDLWQDLAYGWRMLRGNLPFTLVATGSLALGIGSNTAILSTLHSVLRGAMPLPAPDQLVQLRPVPQQNPNQNGNATVPEFLAWEARARSFTAIGVSIANTQDLGLTEDGALPRD